MCGIAGGIGLESNEVEEMLNTILHRGIDNLHIYTKNNFSIGVNILPINGQKISQPIADSDYVMGYNGEIYNVNEISEMNGFNINNYGSDTDILFELIHDDLDYNTLNGQFAIAYMDKEGAVHLVRDYPGISPLFYVLSKGKFIFASESNAIEQAGYEEIRVVVPGTEVIYKDGNIHINEWINLKRQEFVNPVDELDNILSKAVQEQIIYGNCENKIGIMLSGGVDSSLLVHYATKTNKEFCVFTINGADNEYAEQVCKQYSLRQIQVKLDKCDKKIYDIYKSSKYNMQFNKLNNSLYVPTYIIAEAAKKNGIRIVLSGDGIDELFGGYELQESYNGYLNFVLKNMMQSLHSYSLERLDLACMIHTIEPRVPFLSRSVIEAAFSLDEEYKIRPEGDKWIIRKIAEKYFKKEIAWREKIPMQVSTESYSMIYGCNWEKCYM